MERLRKRADFLAAAKGARAPAPAFVLQVRQRSDEGPARFGLTVSRKVGTAVERNRARRRLREMVRLAAANGVKSGYDYVLVARRAALTHPFDRLIADFGGALRRAAGRGHTDVDKTEGGVTGQPGPMRRGGGSTRARTTE